MGATTFLLIAVIALAVGLMIYNKVTANRNKKMVGDVLAQRGMKSPQEYIISELYRLLLDRSSKRWCIYKMGDRTPRILTYDELEEFEVCDHGVVLAASDGSGPLLKSGFQEAVRKGKSVGNVCSRLYVALKLTDGSTHTFFFITQATVRSSQMYASALNYAGQVAEQMLYIMKQAQKKARPEKTN